MRIAAALAAFAVLLAGCGSTDAPVDEPVDTTASSGLPADYEAPPVADPLDPGRFDADPCALLSDAQRAELGLPDIERRDSFGSVACRLHPDGDRMTTVQLQITADRGLDHWAAQCQAATCAHWTPTTVARYPAILDDGGVCRVMVGIAEQATLLVNDGPQPECQRATTMATMALTTLREGS